MSVKFHRVTHSSCGGGPIDIATRKFVTYGLVSQIVHMRSFFEIDQIFKYAHQDHQNFIMFPMEVYGTLLMLRND